LALKYLRVIDLQALEVSQDELAVFLPDAIHITNRAEDRSLSAKRVCVLLRPQASCSDSETDAGQQLAYSTFSLEIISQPIGQIAQKADPDQGIPWCPLHIGYVRCITIEEGQQGHLLPLGLELARHLKSHHTP
jgi:hypothetical protein